MRPNPLTKLARFALACSLILTCVACGEDDPEETPSNNSTSTNNNTTTNNGSTSTNGQTTDPGACETVCKALADCPSLATTCSADIAGGWEATCTSTCENADDGGFVLGLGELECDSAIRLLADRVGDGEMCSPAACEPPADAYAPGVDDQWDACVSDGGEYVQFEPSISSAGRVAGYEQVADLLWRKGSTPSSDDFISAREIYAVEEGLDSRVQRREDEHYPPVTDAAGNTLRCRDEGVPAMDPDRCVGPAKIIPIINDAFQKGISGDTPDVQAARIDAALLWFLYVSTHKEATTCTNVKKDCDSAYAYYTGDFPRDQGIGLAGQYRRVSDFAHDRVWDGILATRCWRDLDSGDEATDLALRDRAIGQMDRGLLYGFSRLIQERLVEAIQKGGPTAADWAWLQIMGPVLDRENGVRAPGQPAAELAAIWQASSIDVAGLTRALTLLDDVYPCP